MIIEAIICSKLERTLNQGRLLAMVAWIGRCPALIMLLGSLGSGSAEKLFSLDLDSTSCATGTFAPAVGADTIGNFAMNDASSCTGAGMAIGSTDPIDPSCITCWKDGMNSVVSSSSILEVVKKLPSEAAFTIELWLMPNSYIPSKFETKSDARSAILTLGKVDAVTGKPCPTGAGTNNPSLCPYAVPETATDDDKPAQLLQVSQFGEDLKIEIRPRTVQNSGGSTKCREQTFTKVFRSLTDMHYIVLTFSGSTINASVATNSTVRSTITETLPESGEVNADTRADWVRDGALYQMILGTATVLKGCVLYGTPMTAGLLGRQVLTGNCIKWRCTRGC